MIGNKILNNFLLYTIIITNKMEFYNNHPDPKLRNIVKIKTNCKRVVSIDGESFYQYDIFSREWLYIRTRPYIKDLTITEYIEKFCYTERYIDVTTIVYREKQSKL
jgi:hypothetical protein